VATDDKVTVAVEEEITVNVVVETAADEGGTKVVGNADAASDVAESNVEAVTDAVSEDTGINVVGIAVGPDVGTADAAPDVVGSKVVEMADAVSEDTEINVVGIAVVPFVGLVPDGS
jgi:hypothetical protein